MNPQIKLPSQRTASLCGQKHIENPIPKKTMCHDVPVPKLAPVPCSALGHTNPPNGHSFISATSPEKHGPPCQGCTDSKRHHLPQSKSDRQTSDGPGKEWSCHRSPRSSELALAFKLKTSPLLAACPLEQTTIKTIAQKYTLMGALTSTNTCLHCLTW